MYMWKGFFCYPCDGEWVRIQNISVVHPARVFCDDLGMPRVPWGARVLFSQSGLFGGVIGPFEATAGAKKAPNRVQTPYDDVFYPCKMFWGRLELLSVSYLALSNFIQWNPVLWHFWDCDFERLKVRFFGVRPEFAPLFSEVILMILMAFSQKIFISAGNSE